MGGGGNGRIPPRTPRRGRSATSELVTALPLVGVQSLAQWGFNSVRGHTDGNSHAGTTATYVRASLPEIADALAALTRELHPLAAVGPAPATTAGA